MTSTILLKIQSMMENANKAEKKLSKYILDNTKKVTTLSVANLSKESGVSTATIVRFSQSLGLPGFKELKLELAKVDGQSESDTYKEITPQDSVTILKEKMALKVQYLMNEIKKSNDDGSFEKVVAYLTKAETIQIFANGESQLVCQYFMNKFSQLNKNVITTPDVRTLSYNLLKNKQSSLLFLISDTGEDEDILSLASMAQSCGAKIVSVTSNLKSSLSEKSTIVLKVSDIDQQKVGLIDSLSIFGQLFIVDLLYSLYFMQDYRTNLKLRDESEKIIKRVLVNKHYM